jgi:acid phosphatase
MLDRALHDRHWTAATEQEGHPFRSLPPAIILDIDETILDNSPAEARQATTGGPFDENQWQAWVTRAKAAALPGSVEFTKYARSRGVTVFYVTNRTASQKAATRSNLEADGFPFEARIDTLYCRGEQPDWGLDKGTRRAAIAARYRILLLFGDDMGDFLSGAASSVEHRHELVQQYRENWGIKWIVLPNAMYGSWENALFGSKDNPSEPEKLRLKYDFLLRMQN